MTDQNLAIKYDVDGLPFFPFVEDHLLLEIVSLVHETIDDFHFAFRQLNEQRHFF
jgi:hypothetical protein